MLSPREPEPGQGREGARCARGERGHARPRTSSSPQCPHPDPRRAYKDRSSPSLLPWLCGLFLRSPR